MKIKKKKLFTNTSFYSSPSLPKKHNHLEIIFENFKVVYNDPRRFGFFQIIEDKKLLIKRFSHLGPEPFDPKFNEIMLFVFSTKRKKLKIFY